MGCPTDLTDIINDIIDELGIPDTYRDEALREGHFANFEYRDIKAALRYWWEQKNQVFEVDVI